jgi:hypothetical protein
MQPTVTASRPCGPIAGLGRPTHGCSVKGQSRGSPFFFLIARLRRHLAPRSINSGQGLRRLQWHFQETAGVPVSIARSFRLSVRHLAATTPNSGDPRAPTLPDSQALSPSSWGPLGGARMRARSVTPTRCSLDHTCAGLIHSTGILVQRLLLDVALECNTAVVRCRACCNRMACCSLA